MLAAIRSRGQPGSPAVAAADERTTDVAFVPVSAETAKRSDPSPTPARPNPTVESKAQAKPALQCDPRYSKVSHCLYRLDGRAGQSDGVDHSTCCWQYFKMLRIVKNKKAVAHKMVQDGVNPAVLDLPPADPLPDELDPDVKVRLSDHPLYGKVLGRARAECPFLNARPLSIRSF